jgi:hypothetical protein
MSKFLIKQPVVHIPKVREFKISGSELYSKYLDKGVTMPFPISDNWYYYSDREGWAELISHLLFKSNLYKADRFDCEDYAMKAMVTCAELFGLNSFRYTYGDTPLGRHGFDSFWTGDDFLLFEPNEGFQSQFDSPVFEWGENDYLPINILI